MKAVFNAAGFVAVGAVVTGIFTFWHDIGDALWKDRSRIVANIQVDNRCGFADFALVVRDTTSGLYAPLRGNTARINTYKRNRLRIELAPQFRDVEFKTRLVPAREEMILVADCQPQLLQDYFAIPTYDQ